MELLKDTLKKYTLPEQEEIKKREYEQWQVYAAEVCKEFGIKFPYKMMIFKQAKMNIEFLKGKVANTKEKFGTENLTTKGRYLISLFRSKRPWE